MPGKRIWKSGDSTLIPNRLLRMGCAVNIVMLAAMVVVNWKQLDHMEEVAQMAGAERSDVEMDILLLNLVSSMISVPLLGAVLWLVLRHHKLRRVAEAERDSFFKYSLDLFTIADTDWNFRQVNPAFTRTLGWSVEELIARPFCELVHPEDLGATLAEIKKLAEDEPTTHFENRYRCKDGSWKTLEWHTKPQPDGTLYAAARDVTDARAAAEALSASEERFSATLRSIGDGVLTTDAQGRITGMNSIAETLTGWDRAEAVGRPAAEVFHIADVENGEVGISPVDAVLASGKVHGPAQEISIIGCDGTRRRASCSAAPIRDPADKVVGVIQIFRDVTKEYSVRRALSDSDALRNAILNSIPANIAVVDRDGTLIAINESWKSFARQNGGDAELTGVGMGTNYLDVCSRAVPDLGDEMQEVADGVRSVLERRQSTYEYEYPCDSPVVHRWFNMTVSPLARDEGGAVITHLNTTSRKETEVALRESEEKFRLIADKNADVIWLSDPGVTKIIYVNEAYERIWGRTCESLYQSPRSFLEPLHPLDRDRVMEELTEHAEGWWDTEYRIFRPDGTIRWIRDRGYPIRDEEGGIYRVTGTATDITHSKQLKTAMAEKAILLEAALTEVREVKVLLLRNDRLASLGRMCAGLIHEINNPLNFASQGVYLLKRNSADVAEASRGDFLEILQDVEDGITRVVRLVTDLRGFTRVTADPSQIFELKPLVEKSLRFFSHELKEAVSIRVDIPSFVRVRGEPNQISQVLVNLIQNAFDAMRAKIYDAADSPEITFTATAGEQQVFLRIRDNGQGIAAEILDQVFDPFFTTKDVGAGMGLGLAISHRIMVDGGGSIDVHSEAGVFCEFILTFPTSA